MLKERPKVEQAVQAVCSREGVSIIRIPEEHAGGTWQLRYDSALGEGGNLQLDLNFMLRVPLWPVIQQDSRDIGSYRSNNIPVLDLHELAAGKLAALLSRHAGRDLFDAHLLLTQCRLDPVKLRLGFILYGAMNRKDWRMVHPGDVQFDVREIKNKLIPVLRSDFTEHTGDLKDWALHLMKECREKLDTVLPVTENEKEFLDRLLDHGEIVPSLLTTDKEMAARIENLPMLQWKALNVRQHIK